jgi:hypothetical protein
MAGTLPEGENEFSRVYTSLHLRTSTRRKR